MEEQKNLLLLLQARIAELAPKLQALDAEIRESSNLSQKLHGALRAYKFVLAAEQQHAPTEEQEQRESERISAALDVVERDFGPARQGGREE